METFPADERRPFANFDLRQVTQRDQRAGGGGKQDIADILDAVPELFRIAEDQIKASLSLVDARGRFLTDGGGDDFANVGHVNAMPGNFLTIDINHQIGLAEQLLHPHVAYAFHGSQDRLDFICRTPQHREILAQDLDRRFRPDPREQFVHPLLNRLTQ